jgi:hypothetical protein
VVKERVSCEYSASGPSCDGWPAAAKETVGSPKREKLHKFRKLQFKEVVPCAWATLQDFLSAVNVIGVGSALHLPFHSI